MFEPPISYPVKLRIRKSLVKVLILRFIINTHKYVSFFRWTFFHKWWFNRFILSWSLFDVSFFLIFFNWFIPLAFATFIDFILFVSSSIVNQIGLCHLTLISVSISFLSVRSFSFYPLGLFLSLLFRELLLLFFLFFIKLFLPLCLSFFFLSHLFFHLFPIFFLLIPKILILCKVLILFLFSFFLFFLLLPNQFLDSRLLLLFFLLLVFNSRLIIIVARCHRYRFFWIGRWRVWTRWWLWLWFFFFFRIWRRKHKSTVYELLLCFFLP